MTLNPLSAIILVCVLSPISRLNVPSEFVVVTNEAPVQVSSPYSSVTGIQTNAPCIYPSLIKIPS